MIKIETIVLGAILGFFFGMAIWILGQLLSLLLP